MRAAAFLLRITRGTKRVQSSPGGGSVGAGSGGSATELLSGAGAIGGSIAVFDASGCSVSGAGATSTGASIGGSGLAVSYSLPGSGPLLVLVGERSGGAVIP